MKNDFGKRSVTFRYLVNKFLSFLLMICLITGTPFVVNADEPKIVIDGMLVNDTGICEVVGHLTSEKVGAQISLLVTKGEFSKKTLSVDNIVYIDQIATGNNGTFYFTFMISSKFANETLYLNIGSNDGSKKVEKIYSAPSGKPGIDIVANNSAMYGKDIYYVPGSFHTSENIADSMVYGGNHIYFKFGGHWYNLLDKKAKDNSFLVPENASDDTEIEKLKPRWFYLMVQKVKLKYN